MPEHKIIQALTSIMARAHVHYSGVAYACGVSPATVRQVLTTGSLPRRSQARRALEDFVKKNHDAASRGDVRFV